MPKSINLKALGKVIKEAKKVAEEYRNLTGKPLGITGEVGEFIAAELLGLELAQAREPGYDAISQDKKKIQIKTRCVLPDSRKTQRMGRIRLDYDWDKAILVLVNEHFEPIEVYQANRRVIEQELKRPGSRARNERGQLSISCFKRIAKAPIWTNKSDK